MGYAATLGDILTVATTRMTKKAISNTSILRFDAISGSNSSGDAFPPPLPTWWFEEITLTSSNRADRGLLEIRRIKSHLTITELSLLLQCVSVFFSLFELRSFCSHQIQHRLVWIFRLRHFGICLGETMGSENVVMKGGDGT